MRKNNKGFTLTEIIVVIVILAIIIGVSITGVYNYVKKGKLNTDITNAKTLKETLSGIEDDPQFYRGIVRSVNFGSELIFQIAWTDEKTNSEISFASSTENAETAKLKELLDSYAKSVYINGLPKANSRRKFVLAIGIKKGGNGQIDIRTDCIVVTRKNLIKYSDDESRKDTEFDGIAIKWKEDY